MADLAHQHVSARVAAGADANPTDPSDGLVACGCGWVYDARWLLRQEPLAAVAGSKRVGRLREFTGYSTIMIG